MCTNEFLFHDVLLLVRVRSTIGFGFVFGRKYHLITSGRHSASAESHTPLSVLFSVLAESEIFTFGRSGLGLPNEFRMQTRAQLLLRWLRNVAQLKWREKTGAGQFKVNTFSTN